MRALLLLVLIGLTSGAPQLVDVLLHDSPTDACCPPHEDGDERDCSPVCHCAGCGGARVINAPARDVVATAPVIVDVAEQAPPALTAAAPPPPVGNGVFHPPRA